MDKLRRELEIEITEAEAIAEAWEAVKREKTKSGQDYKIICKNFSGCYHDAEKIFVYSKRGRSIRDEIKLEESVQYWQYGEVAGAGHRVTLRG